MWNPPSSQKFAYPPPSFCSPSPKIHSAPCKNFHVIPLQTSFLAVVIDVAIFFLTLRFMYTHVMLILIDQQSIIMECCFQHCKRIQWLKSFHAQFPQFRLWNILNRQSSTALTLVSCKFQSLIDIMQTVQVTIVYQISKRCINHYPLRQGYTDFCNVSTHKQSDSALNACCIILAFLGSNHQALKNQDLAYS